MKLVVAFLAGALAMLALVEWMLAMDRDGAL